MLNKRLRSISIGKLIISIIVFLICIGISRHVAVDNDVFKNFYEIVLMQLDSTFSLLFVMSFILLLFSSVYEESIETSPKVALIYLKQSVKAALLFVVIMLIACLAYSVITRGFEAALANEWSYNSPFSLTGKSPIVCFGIAILLFGLRCIFLFYMINLINVLTKKPYWGFWVVLIICFIDFRFYNQTHIPYPLNILPIEHTRLLYTIAFNDPIDTITRGSYVISVLYWIVLIIIIYEIIEFVFKKRGKKYEKGIHTRP